MSAVEQKLNWVFGLALLALAAVGLITYRSTTQLAVTSQQVTHARRVLGAIAELRSSLAQAQSASDNFRLTGNTHQLDAYRAASSLAEQNLAKLRRLTADNAAQKSTLADFGSLMQIRFGQLAGGLVFSPDLPANAAQRAKLAQAVNQVNLAIDARLRKMGDEEQLLLQQRTRRAATSVQRAHFFVVLASILAFIFVGASFVPIRRDVRERRRAERRFRDLLEAAPDAMVIVDGSGRIVLVNAQAESLFGYRREELLGRSAAMLLPERFRDRSSANPSAFFGVPTGQDEEDEASGWELFALRKDGSEFPAEIRQSPLETDEGALHCGAIRDITARKQAEESLRHLSSELLHLQDEERRKIARELHDSTGQYLAALSINLSRVHEAGASLDPEIRAILTESSNLVNQSVQEVRTLSYLLHPPLLEDLGLSSALRWYTQGFAERSGIRVEMDLGEDIGRLPRDVELALFRVVQESLVNVHRHSGSPVAIIRMARHDGEIQLEVADRGHGIPPGSANDPDHSPRPGVGIIGMRERVKELGGQIDVRSGPTGTCVTVHIPVPEARA